MTEVWRKWFLLVGLASGVLIGLSRPTWAMTFQSDIDALVKQSGFIFRGTVKKFIPDIRNKEQNSSIVDVSVDEVLQAPYAFVHEQRLEINAQPTPTSSAQPKLRLGYVKDLDVGCGSAFSLNTTDMGNGRYIFAQDSDDPPYINLNGKNLQLRLTGYSKPKDKEKVGDRSWETYAAGDVKVRIDYIVTKVCTPRDEICETTYLNATMTVSQRAQKTTVKLTGRTGC